MEKYLTSNSLAAHSTLTNANNAIAVGLNLDHTEPFRTEVKPIKQPPAPLMEEFIELIGKWDNQSDYEEVFKREVKDLLSSEYYTFPANKETRDIYYFSRYIVGQSILIDETDVKKYVFSYNEFPLESKTRGKVQSEERPVTTLVFIRGGKKQNKTAFVFHIIEQETEIQNLNQKKVPVVDIPEVGKIKNVIEITIGLKKYKENLSFTDLFEIKQISKYKPSGADQQFTGSFLKIPNSDELKAEFDQATASQHVTSSDGKDLLIDYKRLLTEIADTIYPIKGLINDEAKLQAVLNGLLSSYSDLKLKESSANQVDSEKIIIIPEFQVGAGGRVDMVIQGIGPSLQGTKEYTPIALEFKLIDKNLDEKGMKEEVDKLTQEQNVRYAKGAALKAITDSDKMFFMGVVVNVRAKDRNSLILTSDELIPAKVSHSSIDVAIEEDLEKLKKELSQRLKNMTIQEEFSTLESATAENDYHYWLQQHDIADVARVRYDYKTGETDRLFEVVGSVGHIANQLEKFQSKVTTDDKRKPLTLIVNLDNNHWVTLVVSHQNGQYNGYYADSLGSNAPDNIRQVLQDAQINVNDVSVTQQRDGYNCGLWALENARDINAALQRSGNNVLDQIRDELQIHRRGENYFMDMRKDVSEALSIDQQRIANLEYIFARDSSYDARPGNELRSPGVGNVSRRRGRESP
ncbi:hypothetical protein [Wolbachia endosymbiont (group A) of Urophora cardui]|uniref:hypothetical protein n=1 Tax=Wolbachia endosymbiont (group A) of Urophora cardui TaxID=3066156 RepID=UPI003341F309